MHEPVHAAALILRATGPETGDSRRICHIAYLCDGWHRAIHGTPLIDAPVIAEDIGPMHSEILATVLDPTIGFDPRPKGPGFTKDQAELVMRTINKYATYTTGELRTMNTARGTPWSHAYFSSLGRAVQIPGDQIKDHFTRLAMAGRADILERDRLLSA